MVQGGFEGSVAARPPGGYEEARVRVGVDAGRCEGNAICTALAPAVFDLDSNDLAVVLVDEVGPDQHEAAMAAVDSCPVAAIIVEA